MEKDALQQWDVMVNAEGSPAHQRFLAAPGGVRTTQAFSQSRLYPRLDTDRANGCIRSKEHAYSLEGARRVSRQTGDSLLWLTRVLNVAEQLP